MKSFPIIKTSLSPIRHSQNNVMSENGKQKCSRFKMFNALKFNGCVSKPSRYSMTNNTVHNKARKLDRLYQGLGFVHLKCHGT